MHVMIAPRLGISNIFRETCYWFKGIAVQKSAAMEQNNFQEMPALVEGQGP